METEIVETRKGAALGIKISLGKSPLLIVKAEKGYLCCGYFNKKTIEKLDDCAAVISEVKSFPEMLKKRVEYATRKARELGVKKGMLGEKALDKLI